MERFTNEDSLRVITSMIEARKKEFRDNGSWFLLWGWLVFIACVLHFVLMKSGFGQPYLAWTLMIVGGIISVFKGMREEKTKRVRTYVDQFMNYVLISFLVCLMMVLLNMYHLKLNTYPMIMMVYGIWLFVSGGTLEFRPLIFGGILNWVLALISFYLDFEYQLLALGASVLFGYIIPGYMLRSRYNKAEKSNLATA